MWLMFNKMPLYPYIYMIRKMLFFYFAIFLAMSELKDFGNFKEQRIKVVKLLYVDSNFTNDEVMLIAEAAHNWTVASNNRILFSVYQHSYYNKIMNVETNEVETIFVEKMYDDSPFVMNTDRAFNTTLLGYYDKESDIHRILLIPDRYETKTEMTTAVMHEIGHSLKLKHIDDYFTVMHKSAEGGGYCLTYYDMDYFCHIYGCDVESTNYCMEFYKD